VSAPVKRAGRPPAATVARTEHLDVRLSSDELDALRGAVPAGSTLATWARTTLLAAIPEQRSKRPRAPR
jgi:hypothetical protein